MATDTKGGIPGDVGVGTDRQGPGEPLPAPASLDPGQYLGALLGNGYQFIIPLADADLALSGVGDVDKPCLFVFKGFVNKGEGIDTEA